MKGVFMKLKPVLFILLFALVAPVNVWAAVPADEVTKIYVATFNRAPDAGGLNFWANTSGLTIQQITKEFFKAPETQLKYPEGTTDAEFVNTIYQNVFGRNAEPEGLDYWVNVLGNGWSTRDQMIMTVIEGARNKDLQVLQNKTEVGLYYVNQVGGNHVDGFKFSLANITENIATVNNEKQAIDVIAANAGSLAGDIEKYIAMFTSAGELSPMMDEIETLLGAVLSGDTSVVTITPSLETINLNNPPANITITANFGNGYTPPDSTAIYTGQLQINITGIAFTQNGISANAALTATNVQRDTEPVLNGSMTFSINMGMTGDNTSVLVNVNFSNITSMGAQANGGIALSIPAISGEGVLVQPVTLTLTQFSTIDYLANGTVTISQVTANTYDINLNVTTNQGPLSGILRVQTAFDDLDQGDRATISSLGSLTIEDATVTVNDVYIDSDVCDGLPVSGSIVVTRGSETSTITFGNCTYTIN
jgi:hypothetical protein